MLTKFAGIVRPSKSRSHSPANGLFLIDDLWCPDFVSELRQWLDERQVWRRSRSSFYDQFEARFAPTTSSPVKKVFQEEEILRWFIGQTLGVEVLPGIKVIAHLLVPGQAVGKHCDTPRPRLETVRLVVNIFGNATEGGNLLFRPNDSMSTATLSVYKTGGSALFQLSDRLPHEIPTLVSGIRYSLVISFWTEPCEERWMPEIPLEDTFRWAPFERSISDLVQEMLTSATFSADELERRISVS